MRELMIVMALLVVGCLPKGYIKPQYIGDDAARIVFVERGYMGNISIDDDIIETMDTGGHATLMVSPGRHKLGYQRGYYTALPLTKTFQSGETYYFDILEILQLQFTEYTKDEFNKKTTAKVIYK
jgi:hypothetical protein